MFVVIMAKDETEGFLKSNLIPLAAIFLHGKEGHPQGCVFPVQAVLNQP